MFGYARPCWAEASMIRILGPFPPPYGGVALHCVRLLEALRGKGLNVCATSLGGVPSGIVGVSKWRPWTMLSRSPVHYHTDEGNHRWMRLFSRIWSLTRTPYIVTVHSFRHRPEFRDARTVSSLASAYTNASAIIAISNEVAASLASTLGLHRKNLHVIPSNLPLSSWELAAVLPPSVAKNWRNASIRILANAGRVVSYNGRDLYGIDVLIDAFTLIDDVDAELCIAVGDVVDEALWNNHEQRIGSDPRITIVRNLASPLAPLVKHAHVVVRPTRTEGGPSLTLSEAIELGRIAIGSDAVPRPDGTDLFRNGDHVDLARVLRESIVKARAGRLPISHAQYSDIADQIVKVYERSGFVSTTHTPAEV